MKKFILIIAVLLIGISFCQADTLGIKTPHCWRQDYNRAVDITSSFTGSFGTSADYDFLLSPGASITVSGIGTYNIACDDGATGTTKNYIALYDDITREYISTNVSPNKGPATTTSAGCFDASFNACYIYHAAGGAIRYQPQEDSCYYLLDPSKNKRTVGMGTEDSITYTFPLNRFGDREITVKLGAVSPETATDASSPRIMYRNLKTFKVSIGKPSLLTFAPEKKRLLSTYEETGDQNIEFFFSLMNPSKSIVRLESYSIDCNTGINCFVERRADGNLLYAGFKIGPGGEMIIPATIRIPRSKAPISFAASMDFNYNGINQNCGADSSPCKVKTEPARIDFAYADQQDFQVEIKSNIDEVGCVGEDGMTGQTGEAFAPRINLFFGGNSTGRLISLNECDQYLDDIDSNDPLRKDNNAWVYCSQEEFLTELAAKMGEIGKLREDISEYEVAGRFSEAETLRLVEAKLLSFNSYLRKQSFTQAELASSIIDTNNYIKSFASQIGLSILDQSTLKQAEKFTKLMNATKFKITNEGVLQTSKEITPGIYSVRIDINELTESKQSDYLFKVSGELNPSLDLTVTLEKIQSPPFEWFFYDSNSNNLDEGFGLNTINNTASVYETNVSRRGTVMQYSKTNLGEEDTDFFKSYAVPLFVRLVSDSNGNTNGRLKVVEEEISTQFKPENGTFSYWTGFASSIDNGCATITDAQSTLPYRVSDLVIRQNGNIEFNSFDYPMMNATANSKMYLETVLYLPQSKSMSLVSPMKMYTKNTTCANPQDANCLININTNVKMGEAYDLNMAFTGIKEGKICISKKVSATGEVWDLFWNQNEMLKLLADRKANIISTNRDANLCESREILGG